jgi:diguanylate cyclase (GGDEF)-like protein/PAS domain S-box-containing protein
MDICAMTAPRDATFDQVVAEPGAAGEAYELTLYVSGASDLSARAIADARHLCDAHLAGQYHLSVIDVYGDPAAVRASGVLATPTLVKNRPLPVRELVGEFSRANFGALLSPTPLREGSVRHRTPRRSSPSGTDPAFELARSQEKKRDELLGRIVDPTDTADGVSGSLARMAEAEDMLRAIGAGEVDAFVVSDGAGGERVFTLSTADRPYRMFVENMRDGAATVSSGGFIMYANRRLAEMLSCSRETIVGSPLARFVSGEVPTGWDQIRGPGGVSATVEFDLLDADGVAVPVRVGTSPLPFEGDYLTCLTFTDLSAQKAQDREISRLSQAQAERMADLQAAQAALTEQATHDALTGLPNRALLVDRIDQALAHARGSSGCTSVLFVDLDRFKQVNDTQGHAAGDVVLRRVASRLVAAVRPVDTVSRIGGDEFVVLAPDVDSHMHAVDIGNRLLARLSRRLGSAAEGDPVAASVGIAVSVGGRGTAEILLKEADTAMYQAKSLGRGRTEVFDAALRSQVQQRSTAQRMLQSALDDHRIIAHYQPIIDLSSGNVAGFEALARLAERDGSILSPAAFLPVAEDSGLVVPLGAQVLEMACQEARNWAFTELTECALTVAVNLSSRQFERGDLPALVRDVLKQTGIGPGQLHLELIETAIIDLRPDILRQLESIRDLGVEIGLDDFGTGYASLTHLRRLPLAFVKIDQTFVQGLETDHDDDRIVAAVVDLAANLGLRSIAEGIETKHQLDRLREFGCDQAQGYYFARPLPPRDVPQAIEHSAW